MVSTLSKNFLVKVFGNPRLKKSYGQGTSKDSITGAFSMGKYIEDYATPIDSTDMSKLISKMDSLEASFQSIKGQGPYKHQVAPQRGRHFEKPKNRYSGQKGLGSRKEKPIRNNHNNTRFKPHGRGKGGFQRSPNIGRPRTASKTPVCEVPLLPRNRSFH